jgi:hypothetical protein
MVVGRIWDFGVGSVGFCSVSYFRTQESGLPVEHPRRLDDSVLLIRFHDG